MPQLHRWQRLTAAALSALCACAAFAIIALASRVPDEAQRLAHVNDAIPWLADMEINYVPAFPPLTRVFARRSLTELAACDEGFKATDWRFFTNVTPEARVEQCNDAAQSLRTRYLGCAAMLAVAWLLASLVLAWFARSPRWAPLALVAMSASVATPIVTEPLLRVDYGTDLVVFVIPQLFAFVVLGAFLIASRKIDAVAARTTVSVTILLIGIVVAAGGVSENDEAITTLGVSLAGAGLSGLVRNLLVRLRLNRTHREG